MLPLRRSLPPCAGCGCSLLVDVESTMAHSFIHSFFLSLFHHHILSSSHLLFLEWSTMMRNRPWRIRSFDGAGRAGDAAAIVMADEWPLPPTATSINRHGCQPQWPFFIRGGGGGAVLMLLLWRPLPLPACLCEVPKILEVIYHLWERAIAVLELFVQLSKQSVLSIVIAVNRQVCLNTFLYSFENLCHPSSGKQIIQSNNPTV
jgi:hypothetical protein